LDQTPLRSDVLKSKAKRCSGATPRTYRTKVMPTLNAVKDQIYQIDDVFVV